MFPSYLNLVEFIPGQKLLLERRGFNWRWFPRIGCSLFMLPFLIAPPGMFAIILVDQGPPGSTGQMMAMVVFIPVMFTFWYGVLALFINLSGAIMGEWNRFHVDRTSGELILEYYGRWIWLGETYRINLNDISGLTLRTREKQGDTIILTLTIDYRGEKGKESVSPTFKVPQLDLDKEAMAFLFALANLARIDQYKLTRSDHLETEVKASREDDGGNWRSVPTVDSQLDFEADLEPARSSEAIFDDVETPGIELGSFDPAEYQNSLSHMTKPEFDWNPEREIRIRTPSIGVFKLLFLSLFTGAVGGVVLTVFVGGLVRYLIGTYMGRSLSIYAVGVGIGIILAGITSVYFRYRYRERETVLSLRAETIRLREGSSHYEGAFDSIQRFVMRGIHDHNDDTADDYSCNLMVECDGRWTILIGGESNDRDEAYRLTGSLAEDLAELTDSQWKWKGFRTG
ncbi:MAG: hypothetical protein ABEK50_07065 [bacterium]